MYWKFDFSPETSDIFAVVGVGDVAAVEVFVCSLVDVVVGASNLTSAEQFLG